MLRFSCFTDCADIRINSSWSLQDIAPFYFLTIQNLVLNVRTGEYCQLAITRNGYPYVTLSLGLNTNLWKKITLHKIIALGRIHNGPYEVVEHIDDNPLNLCVNNLRFSTFKNNSQSSFTNKHRVCTARIFRVELYDGRVFIGELKDIQAQTGISRITLYDRFYKGPINTLHTPEEMIRKRILVKSVNLVQEAPKVNNFSNRSIDYRKDNFSGQIELDNWILSYE